MDWTDKRCEELKDLQELVWTCRALNSGSHFIEKLTRVIELAEKLTKGDMGKAERCFPDFLTELAIKERGGQ